MPQVRILSLRPFSKSPKSLVERLRRFSFYLISGLGQFSVAVVNRPHAAIARNTNSFLILDKFS